MSRELTKEQDDVINRVYRMEDALSKCLTRIESFKDAITKTCNDLSCKINELEELSSAIKSLNHPEGVNHDALDGIAINLENLKDKIAELVEDPDEALNFTIFRNELQNLLWDIETAENELKE